jgi:hypothetical protein
MTSSSESSMSISFGWSLEVLFYASLFKNIIRNFAKIFPLKRIIVISAFALIDTPKGTFMRQYNPVVRAIMHVSSTSRPVWMNTQEARKNGTNFKSHANI